jgi:hypothetical protein
LEWNQIINNKEHYGFSAPLPPPMMIGHEAGCQGQKNRNPYSL